MRTSKGRPRLTPELYQERLAAYCSKYQVSPLDTGLPPFPSGQRETPQHAEWLSLYKAHQRVARHQAAEPTTDGRCPVCAGELETHQRCQQFLTLAEALGAKAVDRVRAHLWPKGK
jgi:hypothetical protein